MSFQLCEGVSAAGCEGLKSSFKAGSQDINGLLSAELIEKCALGFIDIISEPVFFFLELPVENSDEYELYYLDNCTKEVARAIMKRYGQLLVNDGASRFGFGSNKSGDEVYFTDFQEFSMYTAEIKKAKSMLTSLGLTEMQTPDSIWRLLSDENEGSLSVVEIEGETVFDIPEALEDAGMYKAKK